MGILKKIFNHQEEFERENAEWRRDFGEDLYSKKFIDKTSKNLNRILLIGGIWWGVCFVFGIMAIAGCSLKDPHLMGIGINGVKIVGGVALVM